MSLRPLVLLIVAVAASFAVIGTAQGPSPRSPYVVEITLNRQSSPIGEQVVASLTLAGPIDVVSARPQIGRTLGDFEVVAVQAGRPGTSGTRSSQSWKVVLTSFESGRRTIGGIRVEGELTDGRTFVTDATRPLQVSIVSPRVRPDDELRPLTPPLAGPEPSPWVRFILFALVVGLVVGSVGVVSSRVWTSYWSRHCQRTFWRRLEFGLSDLARHAPADRSEARESYTRASSILKEGIRRIVRQPVEPLSSMELAGLVATSGSGGTDMAREVGAVLCAIDGIRFSDVVPQPQEHARVFQHAALLLHTVANVAQVRGRTG